MWALRSRDGTNYPTKSRQSVYILYKVPKDYQMKINTLDSVYNNCDFDPETLKGQPIGMFHCPQCGEMVVAGMPHPPRV